MFQVRKKGLQRQLFIARWLVSLNKLQCTHGNHRTLSQLWQSRPTIPTKVKWWSTVNSVPGTSAGIHPHTTAPLTTHSWSTHQVTHHFRHNPITDCHRRNYKRCHCKICSCKVHVGSDKPVLAAANVHFAATILLLVLQIWKTILQQQNLLAQTKLLLHSTAAKLVAQQKLKKQPPPVV